MSFAARILLGDELAPRTLADARVSTFVDVEEPSKQYTSFAWRLALSAVIATGGIAAGSTAVVIGAMLVAPLMSPMLGTSLAVVLGDGKAAMRTLLITAGGVAASIIVAALVAAIIPVDIDTSTNSEVLSRVSPRLVDLIVAVAAGLMAALSLMRKDIPDAIPGIAISASIVPPLCVAGVSLWAGDLGAAFGSMMLFLANYFGIQIVSVVVFLALGIGGGKNHVPLSKARMAWYVTAIAGFVIVGSVLAYTSYDMVKDAAEEKEMRLITKEWLEDTGYSLHAIDVRDDELNLEIAGSGPVPSVDDLHRLLDERDVGMDTVKAIVLYEKVSAKG